MSEINEDVTNSEKQFENVFNLIPNPIYLFERVENDLILIKYNDAAKLFSKGKIDEYLGFKMSDLYPEHLDLIEELKNDVDIKGHLSRELKFKSKSTGIEKTVNTTWYKIRPNSIMVILYDITEQRQVEDALRKSEREKSLLFENIPELIVFQDTNHSIIWCNKAACESVDLSLEQIIGRKCFKIWQNRDIVCENCSVDIALKTGRQDKTEAITPDGRIWDIRGYPVRDDKGNIVGAVELTTDITEPKKVGQKLKESEEKFSKAFHSSPNLMAITRLRDNLFIDVNDAFINALGYSREELINHTSTELNLWVNLEQRNKILKEIRENIRFKNLEIQVNSKKGDQLTMLFSAEMINLNNEEFMITMASDITERKEAEQELKKSEEKSKEEARKLEILNQITKESQKARDLTLLLENTIDSTLELMNFDGGGIYLLKENTREAELVYDKGLPSDFTEKIKRINIDESPRDIIFIKGLPIFAENYPEIDPENSTKWGILSLASIPLFAKDKVIGSINIASNNRHFFSNIEKEILISIGRDLGTVILKMQAEERLKESEEKYRNAFNRSELYKDIFTHDINNILQNILTSTELSKLYSNDPDQSEKVKEVSNLMNEQIIRGKKLVSNVQKLSEVEEFETPIASVEVSSILSKAIEFVKESFLYRDIKIEVQSFQNQFFVNANELLVNIFENIIFNAVKHNVHKNIEILIRISKDRKNEKNYFKFEFLDNGVGIPDSMKPEIFSRKSKEYKKDNIPSGIGLGLLLVNRILVSYNGEIRVEDRIEGDYSKGSNFIIFIPEAV